MARHRARRVYVPAVLSPLRAKHRAQSVMELFIERGTSSMLITVAAALIVLAMVVTDPVNGRS